jgi:multidrug efflux system membrane fusion protein
MNTAPPAPAVRNVSGVLFLLGVIALIPACKKVEGATRAPQRPAAPVRVSSAVEQDIPVYLEQIGKSTAPEVVSIQAQVSGQITQIHFKEGASLKRGDPLFTIDPRPYQAQLDSAEASLAQNQASLDLTKIEFARVEKLIKNLAITKQEYDSRRNAVAVSEAQVKLSRAAIMTAKLNLEHCFIKSPIDGRAGQRLVDLGNVVNPGGAGSNASLVVIQRLDPIYADFTITENDLTAVQRSMGEGTVKVQVRLPDEPDGAREGALTFLDNAVQDGTGTVKLRATLANADHHFWPGRFVKVRLVLNTQKAAVLVASAAPQTSAKGRFVYVVKDDSTAELRPVTLGQRQGDLVAVTEGLKAGERVITAGQLLVAPGGKVRIEEAPASDASKATGGSAGQGKAADASAGQAKAADPSAGQGKATGASGEQSKALGASSAGKDATR